MRVNIYAEEMTDRVEIISKEIEGRTFTGLRLYLELPATINAGLGGQAQVKKPFIHHPGDDDSAAITFWGKRDLRQVLHTMLAKLDEHYSEHPPMPGKLSADVWSGEQKMFTQEDIDRAVMAERERCAKIAKGVEKHSHVISGFWNRDPGAFYQRGMREAAKDIRTAIRNPVPATAPA